MMVEKVIRTIEKYKLLENKDKVLVAVSGGPDSMFLLWVLKAIKTQYKLELRVAHLNHQIRESAGEEASFVSEQAEKFGSPCSIEERDARGCASANKLSLEEAARELRYDFLERTARKFGMNKIATGHTLSDEVETFILRVARGTGKRGLLLIHPKREINSQQSTVNGQQSTYKVIRPLIELRREEIIQFLNANGIAYKVDESNYDIRYPRNFVRHRIVPVLLELSPHFPEQVIKLREILENEEDVLNTLVQDKLKKISLDKNVRGLESIVGGQIDNKKEILLDLKGFLETPVALKRRILREIYTRFPIPDSRTPNYPSFEEVENTIRYIENNKGGKKFDFGEIKISKSCNKIKFTNHQSLITNHQLPIELPIPGEIKWDGIKIKSRVTSYRSQAKGFDDTRKAFFDFDEISPPLWIRERKDGDTIKLKVKSVQRKEEFATQPFRKVGTGLKPALTSEPFRVESEKHAFPIPINRGRVSSAEGLKVIDKKLKDVFIDEKVPVWERRKIPLLVDREGILWIVGRRRAHRANIGKNTDKMLKVWIVPQPFWS